jgi:hypothetical protein
MMDKYYLRVEDNGGFGFVLEGIHDIKKSDIKITNEDYDKFFKLQSSGKQFRLKDNISPEAGLFGYIEEFTPEPIEVKLELGAEDYLLDLEYRVSLIELGV